MFKIVARILIFIGFFIFIYRSNHFTHNKFLHYPAPQPIAQNNQNLSNSYKIGKFQHKAQLTWTEQASRKRINNYLFISEKNRKLEVALIDLNFASVLNVNYFSEDRTQSFQRDLSFSLPENFNDYGLVINQSYKQSSIQFHANEEQIDGQKTVVSYFKITETKDKNRFQLQFKHFQPLNRCVTYLRNGIVSFKCYGGRFEGYYSIQIRRNGIVFAESEKAITSKSTAAFDGFRASGFKWYWVWGMGSGQNQKGQHISINFGTVRGIGEDFLHVDNKVIPIKAIEYELNENKTAGDSLTFRSFDPVMSLTFEITAKEHKYKDMVVLKNDMVKFQGYWSGQFIDASDSQTYKFQRFPGLVQTANSIF